MDDRVKGGPVSEQPIRRVAMISVHTSPLAQPGTGDAGGLNVYVVESARELAARGVEVEIFTRRTAADLPDVVEHVGGGDELGDPGVRGQQLAPAVRMLDHDVREVAESRGRPVPDDGPGALARPEAVEAAGTLRGGTGYKKEKAWKVIEFLQAERKISVNGTGMISLSSQSH